MTSDCEHCGEPTEQVFEVNHMYICEGCYMDYIAAGERRAEERREGQYK